jgi:CYTH domain-containing protein/8-oxo-dGTP pyrophosphatase MutT (NUDIX family)
MATEIERKFLVGEIPPLPRLQLPQNLCQHYIAGTDGLEVRIRKADRRHWLTIKSGTGLERQELEISLSGKQYRTLLNTDTSPNVSKQRYRIRLDAGTAELDIYNGALTGLKIVEVEFPDLAASAAFSPPGWFGPEVTGDHLLTNANLARLDNETARQNLGPLLEPPRIAYGAIPVLRTNGQTQVVIITTKSRNRWLFPKGTPEDGKSPQTIALEESLEEAGVEGTLLGQSFMVGYWRDRQYTRIEYWPLLVSTVHNYWEEYPTRQRVICTPEEACKYLANPAFAEALNKALKYAHQ